MTRLHFLFRWTSGFSTSFGHPNYTRLGIRRVAYSMTAGRDILIFLAFLISLTTTPHRAVYRLAGP
jgi:hypothetical protein